MATERPSQTSIFIDRNGRRVSLFLETSVRDRTKLVRAVLKHDGLVVHEALKADILIAEGSSKEVKEFVQAWGNDKVILDAHWIYKCIQARRYIGEDESWAGCDLRSVEFGCDAEEQREDEDEEQDQLQEESQLSREVNINQSSVTANQSHHYQTSLSPKIKISDSPPPTKKRRLEEHPSLNFSEAPYNPHVLQTPQQGASDHTHQVPPYAAGPSAPAIPQLTQDISALGRVLSSPQLAPLLNTLHTAIQPLLAIQQILSQEGVLDGELRAQLANIGSTSMPNSSSQQFRQTPLSTQSDAINSFTSRSDTTAPNLASPRSEYGPGPTTIVQKYLHRTNSPSSSLSSDDESRKAPGTGSASKRKYESAEKAPASQQNNGFFFSNGVSSKFYIDMSVRNRKNLISIVRKNGGEIVTVMSDADFVVLDDRSPAFSKTAAAVPSDKTAVLPKWLTECAEEQDLIPIDPYRVEIPSSSSSSPSKEHRPKAPSSSQKTTPTSSQKRESKPPMPSTPKQALHNKVKQSPQRMRSPSPPAHIEALSDTKYVFTQGEKEWFLRYIRFRWQQDPNISINALLNAITRKAPHHPKNSWSSAFRVKWAAEVDALRREMNIH